MSLKVLPALLTTQDNWEIVRDRIVDILNAESAAQQALAVLASADPEPYAFTVYADRANPWPTEEGDINTTTGELANPLVNVWFDTATEFAAGSSVGASQCNAAYNIDVYGRGVSVDLGVGGHIPGDAVAVGQAQRIARLIRRFLTSQHNIVLQLPGVVGRKSITNITSFQPDAVDNDTFNTWVVRLVLQARITESNERPNLTTTLEEIHVTVDNEAATTVIEADFDVTP